MHKIVVCNRITYISQHVHISVVQYFQPSTFLIPIFFILLRLRRIRVSDSQSLLFQDMSSVVVCFCHTKTHASHRQSDDQTKPTMISQRPQASPQSRPISYRGLSCCRKIKEHSLSHPLPYKPGTLAPCAYQANWVTPSRKKKRV